ncbi:MFS transporter [Pseudomonas aegrilactucae]|uniref:MFS transporter n=1 Tax=Pseudomonas aegrilactucae TaxID=2854028 RepID=A0A9Q3AFX9_9PSED|nr:MFS transporter [Pseudomonas aegrilactucae]MBV6288785.1 MFS transporter [Pseudomonas aegrilactucae]
MRTAALAGAQASSSKPWLAVVAVALATFSVVTTEMLPVGMLTAIADSLGSTTGTAGLMISLPALLAALFAPLVVIASGGLDRRTLLCGLLGLLVLANSASALAPSMAWLLAARVLVGFCIGGIWAIAGGLATRLVPDHSVGLATSIIFGGVAAASVLGVPLGALIGDNLGWRWAFGIMALFSALVLALHVRVIAPLPVTRSASVRQFTEQLHNRMLQAGLVLTLLLVAGHFAAFTFVRPLLQTISMFDTQWISPLLFAYGVAGIVGNFAAGMAAAHRTTTTVGVIGLGLLATAVLFLVVGDSNIGGALVLLVWGLAYGGVSVALMTWMMKAAPHAVEIAASLYVGVFNIGIALGAGLGGLVVDGGGPTGNLWLAGALTAGALLVCCGAAWRSSKTEQPVARQ